MLSLNRVLEWKKDIEISKEVLFKLGFETNDENIWYMSKNRVDAVPPIV